MAADFLKNIYDMPKDPVTLDVLHDFGFVLHFESVDKEHLPLEELERKNSRIIRNYSHVFSNIDIEVSLRETRRGQRFLCLNKKIPTFDFYDRDSDSWHTLYLIENEEAKVYDGVYAKGGYSLAGIWGYKRLLDLPQKLAELPSTEPLYTRKEKEQFEYKTDNAVFQCIVDDRNTAVSIMGIQTSGIDFQKFVLPDRIEHYPVEKLGNEALKQLEGVKELQLPKMLYEINGNVFQFCRALEKIQISSSNTEFMTKDGVLYTKDEKTLLRYPMGSTRKSYRIANTAVYIEKSAFEGCEKLKEIIIPESVEYIGNFAFLRCTGLEHIELSNGIKDVGWGGFHDCKSLAEISIPNQVRRLSYTFVGCSSLKMVKLPDKLDVYERNFSSMFMDCDNLEEIRISDTSENFLEINGVIYSKRDMCLVYYPYQKTDRRFVVPDNVTSIWKSAFSSDCRLEELVLPESMQGIHKQAFEQYIELKTLYLPKTAYMEQFAEEITLWFPQYVPEIVWYSGADIDEKP